MVNINVCFMAVQVVSRHEDGSLHQWYDGEQRGTLQEAKDDAKDFAKAFPGTRYQVIERKITEVGAEVVFGVSDKPPRRRKQK